MSKRGFTLIEVLISMVILGIGLLAVVKMSLMYVNANTFNHMLSQATILSQEKMEEIVTLARDERVDKYSGLDFDYIISEEVDFTSLLDETITPNTSLIVDGMLSGGNGGTDATAPWDSELTYKVMFDDGAHEDGGSGDGVFGTTDEHSVLGPAGNAVYMITRAWTVEPIVPTDPADDINYAIITVTSTWIDRYGNDRDVTFQSLVYRRQ